MQGVVWGGGGAHSKKKKVKLFLSEEKAPELQQSGRKPRLSSLPFLRLSCGSRHNCAPPPAPPPLTHPPRTPTTSLCSTLFFLLLPRSNPPHPHPQLSWQCVPDSRRGSQAPRANQAPVGVSPGGGRRRPRLKTGRLFYFLGCGGGDGGGDDTHDPLPERRRGSLLSQQAINVAWGGGGGTERRGGHTGCDGEQECP